jgi:hypothetical protein
MPARNTIQMAIQNKSQQVKSDGVGGADGFQQTGVGNYSFVLHDVLGCNKLIQLTE